MDYRLNLMVGVGCRVCMSFEPTTSTVGENMANIEIKLNLSVDLDIKAERDDIPHLTDSVKQQIAGAFAPAALIGGCQHNLNSVA